mgnify:CR=1 FL=1
MIFYGACFGQIKPVFLPEFDSYCFVNPYSQEMYYLNFNLGSFKAASGWAKEGSQPKLEAIERFPEEKIGRSHWESTVDQFLGDPRFIFLYVLFLLLIPLYLVYRNSDDPPPSQVKLLKKDLKVIPFTFPLLELFSSVLVFLIASFFFPNWLNVEGFTTIFLIFLLVSWTVNFALIRFGIDPYEVYFPPPKKIKDEREDDAPVPYEVRDEREFETYISLLRVFNLAKKPDFENELAFDEISQICLTLKEKIGPEQKKMILIAAYRIFSLKSVSPDDRNRFHKRIESDLEICFSIDENSVEYKRALKFLGLTDKISFEELDRVYKLKLERTNPNKLREMDPEIQQFAQRKFEETKKAYSEIVKKISA